MDIDSRAQFQNDMLLLRSPTTYLLERKKGRFLLGLHKYYYRINIKKSLFSTNSRKGHLYTSLEKLCRATSEQFLLISMMLLDTLIFSFLLEDEGSR